MIPAAFDYLRPGVLEEAVGLLAKHGADARVLAGGHSLLPAMKLGLAQPKVLVDLGRIAELRAIREADGWIAIGAMATHDDIESSDLLKRACPLLPEVAGRIGDWQVRNRGTIGGSLAHADPAADWPAPILALEAELEAVGPGGRRTIAAKNFFVDLFQTALRPGEILRSVRVPVTAKSVAYQKFAQKASGFAICGVAAVIEPNAARVAITGVGFRAYRASAVESRLRGKLSAAAIASAAEQAARGVEPLADLHASAEYRAHLARVLTRRALERALSRN
ncbi:MAG TPA: xanthine dehydrogenase family protein subunit M [Gemmatimonadales bacterium]|nr:xanthine dehydrogenase family protein subunit M [Gemmatimonadales bacterium]